MPTIAYIVHRHLREAGTTEAELAARWFVSQRAVSKYVTGAAEPSEATLYRAWQAGDELAGRLLAIKMPALKRAIEHKALLVKPKTKRRKRTK